VLGGWPNGADRGAGDSDATGNGGRPRREAPRGGAGQPDAQDLAGEQDVLAGLRHRAVSGRHHEDRAVHLRGTRDHVLDVVSVTRAVDVGVVTALRLVLHVRGGDGDAALALLRGVVDLIEAAHLAAELLAERLGDGSSEGRLAVVDVTDGAHVHVGLRTVELLLRHHRSSCASERGATIRVTTRHVLPKRPQHATRGPVGRA